MFLKTGIVFALVLVLLIGCHEVYCYAKLGKTMKCVDGDCSETISEGKAKLAYQPRDNKFLKLRKGDVVLVKGKKAGAQTDLWGGQVMGSEHFGFFPSAFVKEYVLVNQNPSVVVNIKEFLGQNEEIEEVTSLSNGDQKITIKRKKDDLTDKASQGDKGTTKITSENNGAIPSSTLTQSLPETEAVSGGLKLDTVVTNADSSESDSKNPTTVDIPPINATPALENDLVTKEEIITNENPEQNRSILNKEPAQSDDKQNEEGPILTDAVTVTTTNPVLSNSMKEHIKVSPEKGNENINHINDDANEEKTETQKKQPADIEKLSDAIHDKLLNAKDPFLANNPVQNVDMKPLSQSPFSNNDQTEYQPSSVDAGGPNADMEIEESLQENEIDAKKSTKLDISEDLLKPDESGFGDHNLKSGHVEIHNNYSNENIKQRDNADNAQEKFSDTQNKQFDTPDNIPEENTADSKTNTNINDRESKTTQTDVNEQHETDLLKEEFLSSGIADKIFDNTKVEHHIDSVAESESNNANDNLPVTHFNEDTSPKSVNYNSEIIDRDDNPVSKMQKQVSDNESGDDKSDNIGKEPITDIIESDDSTTQAGDDGQNLMEDQHENEDFSDNLKQVDDFLKSRDVLKKKVVLSSENSQIVINENQPLLHKFDKHLVSDNINNVIIPSVEEPLQEQAIEAISFELSDPVDDNVNQNLDLSDIHNGHGTVRISENREDEIIEKKYDIQGQSKIDNGWKIMTDFKKKEDISLSKTSNGGIIKTEEERMSEQKEDIQRKSEIDQGSKIMSMSKKKEDISLSKPSNSEVVKIIEKEDVIQGPSGIDNGWKSMGEFEKKEDISLYVSLFDELKETSNLPNGDNVDNSFKEVKIEVDGSENSDYATMQQDDIRKVDSIGNNFLNKLDQITVDPEAETLKDKTINPLENSKDQNENLVDQEKKIDHTLYVNGDISANVNNNVEVDKNEELVEPINGDIFPAYDTNMENPEEKHLTVKDKESFNTFEKKEEYQVETEVLQIDKAKYNAGNILQDVYNIADPTKEIATKHYSQNFYELGLSNISKNNEDSSGMKQVGKNFKVSKTTETFTSLENSESNSNLNGKQTLLSKDKATTTSKNNKISNFDASLVKLQFLEEELKSKMENEAPLAIETYQVAQELRTKLISIVKEIREMQQVTGQDSKDLATLEAKEIKQRLQTLEGKINQWQADEQNLKTESGDTEEEIQKKIQNLESLLEEREHHQDTMLQARTEAVVLKERIEKLENMLVADRQEMDSKAIESTAKETSLLQHNLFDLQGQLDGNSFKNKNIVERVKEEAESLKNRLSLLENEIIERKQNEENVKNHSQQEVDVLMGRISILENELMQRKADENAILSNQNEAALLKEKVLELEINLKNALTTPDKKTDEKLAKLENELTNRKTSEQKSLLKSQEQTSILEYKIKMLETTLENQQKANSNKYQQEVISIKNNLLGLQEELEKQKMNENVALKSSSEREQKLEDRIFMLENELQHMVSQERQSQQNDERSNNLLMRITALETDLQIATGKSEHKKDLVNQPREDFSSVATFSEENIIQDLYNIMASKQQCPLKENVTQTEVEIESKQTMNTMVADLSEQETGTQMTSLKEKSKNNGPSNEKHNQHDDMQNTDLYESLHEGIVVDWDESVVEKTTPKTSSWDESLLNVEQFNAQDKTDLSDAANHMPKNDEKHSDDSIPNIGSAENNTLLSNSENITQFIHNDTKSEKHEKAIDIFAKDKDSKLADELIIEENERNSKFKEKIVVETGLDFGDKASESNSMDRKTAHQVDKEIEYPNDELKTNDYIIQTASDVDETTPDIDQIEYEEGTNPIHSATMKLFILVGKLPYDVFYILSPIGNFWLSLLPEEFQKDLFGVEWHIVLSTAVIGFFLIWLLIWRSRVSKRKVKEARLCNTVEELKKQLDEMVTEKLNNENDLKTSQSELNERKHTLDTAEHQLSIQLESNTKLQKEIEEHREQNKRRHEEINLCSSKLKKVEEEKSKILNESIQKSNIVADNELTLKDMEKELKQLQKESQDKEKQKRRLEDNLDDNRKQLKKEEKSKEDIIKKMEKFKKQADDAESQTKKMKQELEATSKENISTMQEVDILKDCLLQFKGIQECLTENGDDDLSEDDIIIKQKAKLKNLIDVAAIQKQLKQTETEKSRVSFELEAERKSREETEARIGELEASCENEKSVKSKTERDLQLLQAKLNVMQEFYAKREVEMQGKLGKEQNAKELQQSQLEEQGDRSAKLLEQIAIYKRMNDEAKKEYEDAEKQRKNEITQFEKKAHSNWLASREAERKLDEATREITQLRVELSDYQLRVREMEDRDPIIVRPRPGVPPFPGPHRGHPNSPLPVRNGSLRMIGNTPPPPRRVPSPAGSLQDEIRRPDRPPSQHSHTGRRPPSQGPPPGPMYDNSFSGNRSLAPMHDEGFQPHQGDGPPPMRGGPPPIRTGPPMLRDRPLRADPLPKRDGPPMARDGPPPMRDGPPFMRDGPPPILGGPPFVRDGPQPLREIPPFVRDGPPIMRDSPPPMADGQPLRYANPPMRTGPPRNPSGFQPMHRGPPPKRPGMGHGPMTSSPYMERPPIPSQSPLGGHPPPQSQPPSSLLHSHVNHDRMQNFGPGPPSQRSNYDHDLI